MSDFKSTNFSYNMFIGENVESFLNKHFADVKNFDLDNFIMEYRKYMDLPNIQKDLKTYYESICCEISELINKDYVDYIILSNTVLGSDKYIKTITSVLNKLQEYISESKHNLNSTLNEANLKMKNKMLAHEKKRNICNALFVLDRLKKIKELNYLNTDKNLSLSILEQNVLLYSFVEFHYNANLHFNFLNEQIEKCTNEKIMNQLKHHFLNSISNNDSQTLSRVLHMYLLLNKEVYAENDFREAYVKKYMQEHISEKSILNNGIQKVYENILNFIPTYCSALLLVTGQTGKQNELSRNYNFLINAVWPEVVEQFQNISPTNVYTPQNIKKFHKDYSATMLFLQKFEQNCGTQASVKKLRELKSYREFLEKWNTDIYFRMAFMEIASEFEKNLSMKVQNLNINNEKSSSYILSSSYALKYSTEQCWSDEIFLLPQTYNFWRLTLQLISRYNNWAINYLKSNQKENVIFEAAAAFLVDVELLIQSFEKIFLNKIQTYIQKEAISSVKKAFQDSLQKLKDISAFAEHTIKESLTEKSYLYLARASDIPKLFRKTNREIPSTSSEYVVLLSKFIEEFIVQISSVLHEERKSYFLLHITNTMTNQWANIIDDILTSNQKMEKSLKILKRAKPKATGETDVEKIKHQLKLDVNFINDFFEKLNIENEDNYKRLMSIINSF